MSALTVFQGTISGINKAVELIKAINNLDRSVEINQITIELQDVILAAQSNAFSALGEQQVLLEKIGELEKEIANMKAWETEKQKYELRRVGHGAFAYVIKDSMKGTEPAHWICATCYENGKKSVLQSAAEKGKGFFTTCHACKSHIEAQVPFIPEFKD